MTDRLTRLRALCRLGSLCTVCAQRFSTSAEDAGDLTGDRRSGGWRGRARRSHFVIDKLTNETRRTVVRARSTDPADPRSHASKFVAQCSNVGKLLLPATAFPDSARARGAVAVAGSPALPRCALAASFVWNRATPPNLRELRVRPHTFGTVY